MIPQEVFYFFIIPWLMVIGSIPGIMLTFLFSGVGASLLGYLPSEKDKTKSE